VISGSGALLTATGVSVTTHGDADPSTGNLAIGAYNGVADAPTDGTVKLTHTTIVTTGSDDDNDQWRLRCDLPRPMGISGDVSMLGMTHANWDRNLTNIGCSTGLMIGSASAFCVTLELFD
jgi:hypothetical protein